jgi:hypothetical protein
MSKFKMTRLDSDIELITHFDSYIDLILKHPESTFVKNFDAVMANITKTNDKEIREKLQQQYKGAFPKLSESKALFTSRKVYHSSWD